MFRRLIAVYLLFYSFLSLAQEEYRFSVGERLSYHVSYHLMGIWVGAGKVTFSVDETSFLGHDCYQFKGTGVTYPRYNWFFEVDDTYMAFADKDGLKPYRFFRDVSEGSFYFREENLFDHKKQRVYSVLKVKERPVKVDTHLMDPNVVDVLSMIYSTRNLDFDNYQIGEKVQMKMFIDRESFNIYIKYLGTDTYDHSEYGEVECHVFSPLLVEGSMFRSGERMKVWVSKDENLIPVYIESDIRVGSIRSELIDFEGLRFPFGEP